MSRRVLLDLSIAEAQALSEAADAGTIDDAIDHIGFDGHEKASYHRAADALRDAIKAAQEPVGRRRRLSEIEWDVVTAAVNQVLAGERDWLDEVEERALHRAARKLNVGLGESSE